MFPTQSRYAKVHKFCRGPGDAQPTALQVVRDENRVNHLADKVIIVTGYLGKAKNALGDIAISPRVYLPHLDLNSLASVRACAEEFKSRESILNILIENAGVMACPKGRTPDGFGTRFGTNHLAHFLFFYLLKPLLLSSSIPSFHSRVVMVEYGPWKAYGQSKTANLWTANEIKRCYGSKSLHAFSLHPDEQKSAWDADDWLKTYWKSPEQGAATSVWGVVARGLEGTGGKYSNNCQIASPADPTKRHGPGYATWAYHPDGEANWAKTFELLQLEEE
ncbi:dehydrogenase with different specificitie [Aspergillus alliaceus]|uniref:Dehydrogenase with different specificitie n=1 Tax=Petromyces alliaceus TaxID=209559 RepID=A0A5N7C8X3_PETAA|nr:dehydrogenase with different specificitie [Aspergillus alliaceus]